MIPALIHAFEQIDRLDRLAAHSDVDRKEGGITYTPVAIAREMVALAEPQWSETIHEPSCGRGVFVFALVDYWLSQGKTLQEVHAWAARCLWASDIDQAAVADLGRLWDEIFQGLGSGGPNLLVDDGLFGAWSDQSFDLILGNPPYVRIQNLPEAMRKQLRGQYTSCAKGNVDLYYAFFEDALKRARRVCYIMPNSWFHNASAACLRQLAHGRVEKLIDFQSRLIFAPVRAYTAIVLAGNGEGRVSVRGNLPSEGGTWSMIERADERLSAKRWTPLVESHAGAGRLLGDAVEVVSGIATLADKAFILPSPKLVLEGDELFVEQQDPEFPSHILRVPIAFAPRLVKATKPEAFTQEGPRILCPYDEKWVVVAEEKLTQQCPDLLLWLERRRETLEGRDRGKTQGYEGWYAYGRRQGFWHASKGEQLLLVPQMGNGKLVAHRIKSDTIGPFLFTSGFVLRPKDGTDIDTLQNTLQGANAWAFVEREGRAWAGSGDYRTIGARSLRKMPLPA